MTAYVPGIEEKDLKKIIVSLQQIAAGRSNAVRVVTLAANSTATAVSDPNVTSMSLIALMPRTADAAAAVGTTYIVPGNKTFTIYHAMNSQLDRTFTYAIQG